MAVINNAEVTREQKINFILFHKYGVAGNLARANSRFEFQAGFQTGGAIA
jgi:hypothetical protein